jgi:hypothetical protein
MALTKRISITWCIDDILSVRPHFTRWQASKVLDYLKRNHDANCGVNWDAIEAVSDILFPD